VARPLSHTRNMVVPASEHSLGEDSCRACIFSIPVVASVIAEPLDAAGAKCSRSSHRPSFSVTTGSKWFPGQKRGLRQKTELFLDDDPFVIRPEN
jgi:hypothetical protein